MDSYAKNHNRRIGGRVALHADALVSDHRVDHRRKIDGSQIAQPTFVAAHGCFTLGGR